MPRPGQPHLSRRKELRGIGRHYALSVGPRKCFLTMLRLDRNAGVRPDDVRYESAVTMKEHAAHIEANGREL